jgi:hypothetical protein
MGLHYNYGDVAGFEALCLDEGRNVRPATESLFLLMYKLGVQRITAENWEEVFRRCSIYQRVAGTTHRGPYGRDPLYATPEHVFRHIGMRVTVKPLTNAAFDKEIIKLLTTDARESLGEFDPSKVTVGDG